MYGEKTERVKLITDLVCYLFLMFTFTTALMSCMFFHDCVAFFKVQVRLEDEGKYSGIKIQVLSDWSK